MKPAPQHRFKRRRTACRNKIDHETFEAARAVIEELRRLEKQSGTKYKKGCLTAYRCTQCKGIHIGHLMPEKVISLPIDPRRGY